MSILIGRPAFAQTYGIGVTSSTPNLGNTTSGASGDTVFRIDPSTGNVSRISGNGARITSGTTRATVTVTCGNQNACTTTQVNVRIGSTGSPTKRARALTNFAISPGTATIVTPASGANPINFRLGPIGKSSSKTFYVGADYPIAGDDTGLATGAAASAFYVWVAAAPANPTGSPSATGTAITTVYRPLALAKTSDLAFGRIVRPLSGSGTVTVNASTGERSVTTGVVALASPVATRASYTVTGEGGRVFTVSVPTTFVMTGPSGNLTVTTTKTAIGTPTLSSSLGSAGTYSFHVGGSFPITSTTTSGAYSGTFNVTVSYN